MDEINNDKMANFLDPKILRNHLVFISLYIAAFEFLKDIIISRPRDFFSLGFEELGEKISPDYQTKVLSRNPSPLYASLDWFKEFSAIDQTDIEIFDNIKKKRNDAVHEMMALIQRGPSGEYESSFLSLVNLLEKIEKWWFAEFEFPLMDELHNKDINVNDVLPGAVLTINMLYEVALGDEEKRNNIYDEFIKQASSQ